jgi:hypothetical protein
MPHLGADHLSGRRYERRHPKRRQNSPRSASSSVAGVRGGTAAASAVAQVRALHISPPYDRRTRRFKIWSSMTGIRSWKIESS